MSKFNLYLFCDDETATLLNDPILRDVDPNVTELSTEQVREIVRHFYPVDGNCSFKVEEIENWSREKLAQAMWDGFGLILDTCAIIPDTEEQKLHVVGEALWETMGDDSSTYAACEVFGDLLKESAVTLVPFPSPDTDAYYADME